MAENDIFDELSFAVDKLGSLDLGYPKGNNCVNSVNSKEMSSVPPILRAYPGVEWVYANCDGISLPDLRNGLFIHGVNQVLKHGERRLTGEINSKGLIIGSSGGSDLFVVLVTGEIVRMSGVPEANGTYFTTADNVYGVAIKFECFVCKIVENINAFCEDDPGFKYLV